MWYRFETHSHQISLVVLYKIPRSGGMTPSWECGNVRLVHPFW